MWRTNGNPKPCTEFDEIFKTHHHPSKEGFGAGLTPAPPHPLGLRGLNPYKLKDTFLRCSAGYKLTRAAPGTSANKS